MLLRNSTCQWELATNPFTPLTLAKVLAAKSAHELAITTVDARGLFHAMVQAAHASGDPGLLFLDEINRHNPTRRSELSRRQIHAVSNRCCLTNLARSARSISRPLPERRTSNGGDAGGDAKSEYSSTTRSRHLTPRQRNRGGDPAAPKIRLGVMGLADLLAGLRIPYDSDQAVALGERMPRRLPLRHEPIIELGERRCSYPALSESIWPAQGISALRNATVPCVAPTGTLSLLAGCSRD